MGNELKLIKKDWKDVTMVAKNVSTHCQLHFEDGVLSLLSISSNKRLVYSAKLPVEGVHESFSIIVESTMPQELFKGRVKEVSLEVSDDQLIFRHESGEVFLSCKPSSNNKILPVLSGRKVATFEMPKLVKRANTLLKTNKNSMSDYLFLTPGVSMIARPELLIEGDCDHFVGITKQGEKRDVLLHKGELSVLSKVLKGAAHGVTTTRDYFVISQGLGCLYVKMDAETMYPNLRSMTDEKSLATLTVDTTQINEALANVFVTAKEGKIEAEVECVLKGNKLRLSSRLAKEKTALQVSITSGDVPDEGIRWILSLKELKTFFEGLTDEVECQVQSKKNVYGRNIIFLTLLASEEKRSVTIKEPQNFVVQDTLYQEGKWRELSYNQLP